jgi:Flp pilus assembly protein TadD
MRLRLAAAALALVLSGCPEKKDEGPPPKELAEGRYLAGTAAYLQGNFKEAHEHYAEVKKLNPADARLPAAEGEVYLAEVKLDDALKSFEEAAKLEPKRATTWSRIGYILELKGKRKEAREALDKALELNPKDFNAMESIGDLELKDGNLEGAVKRYLAAADVAPDLNRPVLVMRAVEELLKKNKNAEALVVLEEQSKKGVTAPDVMTELGNQLVAAERLKEAVDAYTVAAKGNPKDPTLWELVGEIQMKLDKPADAEASFRESLRVKDRGVVHASLARLCLARKDKKCVDAELDLALEKASGEEPRELLDIADLLASLGRKKDGLALVTQLADEKEQAEDVELQLRAAKMAKDAGDKAAVKKFCERVVAVDGGAAPKCP